MRRLQPLLCLLALLVASISALDRNSTSDLHTRGRRVPACGPKDGHQGNHHVIDLSEPENPGPFHDLTTAELKKLRAFLEKDPSIQAGDPKSPSPNSSYIFAADLLVPDKSDILNYLDKKEGLKPERKARVVLFRGDKTPAVVEELVCGPLPEVQRCELLKLNSRRNPIEYSFRPYSDNDVNGVVRLMEAIEKKAGHILKESYGAKFLGCKKAEDCLTLTGSPVGSELTRQPEKRMSWLAAAYNLPYKSVHILDLTLLVETSSSDMTQWSLVKLWYGNKLFSSLDELVDSYNNGRVNKTKVTKPVNDHNLFSSLKQKGDTLPTHPQRPPTLVEPDGKRYSVQGKQVKYLGWSFNFRLSSLTGPAVYDVKYQGQRVAYEVALSEIGVFYSGYGPLGQTSNYVDSSLLLGSWSRALVPGGDCPDTATLVSTPFMSQTKREPDVHPASICLFEQNNGYPLRRHLAYDYQSGSFYGGLLDSVLIMRSALTIDNYDYLVDVIFHQNGVIEGRIMSTGYIQGVFYTNLESPYGFQIHENLLGNVHHHMAHFKVDLDIEGTSNRYQTLDIVPEEVSLSGFPDTTYSQTRVRSSLKASEMESVYDMDLKEPKYHIIHNEAKKSDKNAIRGYRIQINCASKNLVKEGQGNEKTMTWGRHQMVVTKHKDDEISSSSIYGMFDSSNPVVDFSKFYSDNETIVDEDLVAWITCGMHHIPHTEDLPVTPTVGNHLSFFLLPYNFFPVCPSMGSRDAIYVEHIDREKPHLGVKVERHGNIRDQCVIPSPTLEEDVAENPDLILESS